jgi:hypothetical protein
MSLAYSFLDVNAALVGPGGAINLGNGAGVAEEGITVEPNADVNELTVAADGTPMHSLSGNRSGVITVTVLKTSPVNQALQLLYDLQTAAAALHGQNTITITTNTGDAVTCTSVAFKRATSLTYGAKAGMNAWRFDAGAIFRILGNGV